MTTSLCADVDHILAALARIAQGSLDDADYAIAVDQWDCFRRYWVL